MSNWSETRFNEGTGIIYKKNFRHTDFVQLCRGLKVNTVQITQLILESVNLSERQLKTLAVSLSHNKTVQDLSLSNNRLSATKMSYFNNFLPFAVLTSLNLENNYLCDDGILAIITLITNVKTLLHVNLGGNHIGDPGVEKFSKYLVANYIPHHHGTKMIRQFPNLKFQNNKISDAGLKCLLKLCTINFSISTLDISGNGSITDTGAGLISNFLSRNRSLRHLRMSKCGLSNYGVGIILHSLQSNKFLSSIHIALPTSNLRTEAYIIASERLHYMRGVYANLKVMSKKKNEGNWEPDNANECARSF